MSDDFTLKELAKLAVADAALDACSIADTVVWPKRCCPACGSESLKTTRSARLGDGARMRRVRCRTCNHAFAAFLE